ncbi:GNAT family N-acetyltransferase [Sedimenticola sp.]|uniref:GNAT family N-acetyltransferase n=1 Tax=Sedimenticola sp. TaxID=1940285 RepID=UPI00258D95B9|nr:GNAT family N-acetyltransferase [Sedimenticola sp.]MCW8903848.1 hypothetical protein [Sedimenticola sp.]
MSKLVMVRSNITPQHRSKILSARAGDKKDMTNKMNIIPAQKSDCRDIAELAMMAEAERQARAAGCNQLSIQVFEQNSGVLRLYQRLGYMTCGKMKVIQHRYMRHTGQILRLTKDTAEGHFE